MTQHRNQSSNEWMFQRHPAGPSNQPTDRLPTLQKERPLQRRRGRGKKLVIWLMALTAVAIVLVIGAMLASEAIVKPMVAEQVEQELGAGVQTFINREIAALPEPVNVPQQYLISEAELNQRIAEESDLGPLDDAQVEIHADGVVVNLSAYRMSGSYRSQITAANGAIVVENGSLSGPLSYVIPVEELERMTNEAILNSLVASNLQVTDVTLVEGEIVVTLEPTGVGNEPPSG